MTNFNRLRDVVEQTDQSQPPIENTIRERPLLDREEARLFFAQSEVKARETMAILDELGKGFRVSLESASDHLHSIVRHLDPESEGNYITWETYKLCVDREIAASFPDLGAYERSSTGDPQRDSEILKTLMLEQMMAL